jgi:hypothetical protein
VCRAPNGAEEMTDQSAAYKLAVSGIALLDLQQKYFKCRNADVLAECKVAERKFRTACDEIIHPQPKPKPSLFGDGPEGAPPDAKR